MNICFFCGSASGHDSQYQKATAEIGRLLAKSNSTLVYGGGNIGLMGILADEVLSHGGKVIGVIPHFLMKKEVGHTGLTQLEIVNTMHERKRRMAEISDAFITLPGGWGTLDEFAEIISWKQLGLIDQPVGILNTNSFFDLLIAQMKKMVNDGFLNPKDFSAIKISDNPHTLLTLMGVDII
ncbi:MAG: TIGR00730 family Rossman fold protein [Bacteroidetes bacterium]|nr:TIGR00730 family Rossman fold protein [Bacteroidota bacterium]MBS1539139.1 TIGR00730 family Rossman fold protein [Bacteroidota bacterium]